MTAYETETYTKLFASMKNQQRYTSGGKVAYQAETESGQVHRIVQQADGKWWLYWNVNQARTRGCNPTRSKRTQEIAALFIAACEAAFAE